MAANQRDTQNIYKLLIDSNCFPALLSLGAYRETHLLDWHLNNKLVT